MVSRTYLLGILAVVGLFITASLHADQLHDAALEGDIEQVDRLIAQGADVNAKNNNGRMALYIASRNGHTETVNLLLSNGADVNAKGANSGGKALTMLPRVVRPTVLRIRDEILDVRRSTLTRSLDTQRPP